MRKKKRRCGLTIGNLGSKKGNIGLIMMILSIVAVFTFVIIFIFANKALTEINTDLQADSTIQQEAKDSLGDLNTRFPLTFDSMTVMVMGLLWLAIVVICFFTDTHPIFYALFFIIIVFLLIVGGILSNAWDEISDETDISSLVSNYPKTDWIMNNYLLVWAVILFSGLIAMFVKNRLIE